jgi:hypothetical protein
MNSNSKKSLYLLLIILGGAVLLSFASLGPETSDILKPKEGLSRITQEALSRDQEFDGTEDGVITRAPSKTAEPSGKGSEDQVRTPEADPEITGTAPSTQEPFVTTAEPLVTTAEPEIITAEPESSGEMLPGETGENRRNQAAPIEGDENRSSGKQDRNTEASIAQCDWQITFQDDFEGDKINTDLWDTGYKAGEHEAQYYVEDAFELEDGILRIRAEKRQVRDREYASGILTTQDIFDQTYGLFQVRAKVPAGQGLWPAFWLLPSSENYPLEIDVFEILGHETDIVYMSNHWRDRDSGRSTFHTRGFKGPDFSPEFHVFEVIWKSGEIIWAVDGVERSRETRGVPDEPMFMLLNLAVGGKWPGYPDDSTPFPSYLEVDYVRVYEWSCSEDNSEDSD